MNIEKNINFVLVGAKSTGKTVYLASLFLNSKMVTSQDAKTTKYLKQMTDTLLEGKYPNATAGNLYDLIFNYKDDLFNCTFELDDIDGHFIETLSEKDKHTQRQRDKLNLKLSSSEGIFFFFPYEKNIHEESMKEFNYQIDTIISNLKNIYDDRDSIPVPASILLTKWDGSSYYKSEEENKYAKKYIENNQFLKLAKEKIEQNFLESKIIPISAIGSDINNLDSYNLEKPIQFSLKIVYSIWVKKIKELDKQPKELLIFLSSIYKDIQFYKNGIYAKQYHKLEKEYTLQLINEVKELKNYKEYNKFKLQNKKLIEALSTETQIRLNEIGSKLKNKHTFKIATASLVTILFLFTISTTYSNNKRDDSEVTLFEKVQMEYNNHNYNTSLEKIGTYHSKYDSLHTQNEKKVLEIEHSIKKSQILTKAKNIIQNQEFNNIEAIEKIFTSFSELGIKNSKIFNELQNKKHTIHLSKKFETLKKSIETLSYIDAISKLEENWNDEYYEDISLIHKKLDKYFNNEIKKTLNTISSISNIDEYRNLIDALTKIKSLQDMAKSDRLNYIGTLSKHNISLINEKIKIQKKYQQLLDNGIRGLTISFEARYKENKPLWFNCQNEYEIILNIDTTIYDHKTKSSCSNLTMIWNNSYQNFNIKTYRVNIIELNIIENSHYNNASFHLSANDLIKIYNHKYLKKDIGNGYFIGFKKK